MTLTAGALENRVGLDSFYSGVSPQLLARVRQSWSAKGLDLDAVWRASVHSMKGFRALDRDLSGTNSRPVDLLLLFDQCCAWIDTVRYLAGTLCERDDCRSTPDQLRSLVTVTARLRVELASIRLLLLEGLTMPALQISRSVSEDVDLALAMLVRRSLARKFVACTTPEASADFWRRHVSGGRAFRTVTQELYRHGLDHTDDSEYARWRKEVLVFLGSVVHTSPFSVGPRGEPGPLDPAAQECLSFVTIRLQEMCGYARILGTDLRDDLERLEDVEGLMSQRRGFALAADDIIIDQLRWLMDN